MTNKLATRTAMTGKNLFSAADSVIQDIITTMSRDYPNNLRFISDLWDEPTFPANSYPPYNIMYGEKSGEYVIEVALAGFGKKDLEVEFVKDKKLTIRSRSQETELDEKQEEESTKKGYVKKGIGKRGFSLSFSIPQHSVVESCEMRDGLLVIEIKREIPEEERPKLLAIR